MSHDLIKELVSDILDIDNIMFSVNSGSVLGSSVSWSDSMHCELSVSEPHPRMTDSVPVSGPALKSRSRPFQSNLIRRCK